MRKLIITVLLFSTLCISNANADNYDFRQTKWGMSKQQVIAAEGSQPEKQTTDGFEYADNILGKPVLTRYYFVDNKLVMGKYIFLQEHTDKNFWIDDYKSFQKALTDKYGKPQIDDVAWSDQMYRKDKSKWGFAVSLGHVKFRSKWEIKRTAIWLGLNGNNLKVFCRIEYLSKELYPLYQKKQKQETKSKI